MIRGRHALISVRRREAKIQMALLEIARHEREITTKVRECPRLCVEPKIGLALLGIRTMALKASVGKNRADVALKVDLR